MAKARACFFCKAIPKVAKARGKRPIEWIEAPASIPVLVGGLVSGWKDGPTTKFAVEWEPCDRFHVQCECGTHGPIKDTADLSVSAWNAPYMIQPMFAA